MASHTKSARRSVASLTEAFIVRVIASWLAAADVLRFALAAAFRFTGAGASAAAAGGGEASSAGSGEASVGTAGGASDVEETSGVSSDDAILTMQARAQAKMWRTVNEWPLAALHLNYIYYVPNPRYTYS